MSKLSIKLASMVIITVILMIITGLVQSLISERISLRDTAAADISASSVKPQSLVGPIIAVPYQKITYNSQGIVISHQKDTIYFFPDHLNVSGELTIEERYRGIYKANIYTFKGVLAGWFELPEKLGFSSESDLISYEVGEAYLVVKVSDVRGVSNMTQITMNSEALHLSPLHGKGYLSEGVKGHLKGEVLERGGKLNYTINLEVMGMQQLNFVPVGKETTVKIEGAWSHPSFVGDALPKTREVQTGAFQSTWEVNQFSNIVPERLGLCLLKNNCETQKVSSFGVNLMDTVDHYRKSDRAIKYALLFIGLTFAGFFIFEIVREVNIHPMQYALVGIALVLFYLLLLSFSEHIGFFKAYLIAASACVTLITFYMHSALRTVRLSLSFGGLLLLLYITLYILLNGEEYSLLLGTILLFVSLGSGMVLTRNIDWGALLGMVENRRSPSEYQREILESDFKSGDFLKSAPLESQKSGEFKMRKSHNEKQGGSDES